MGTRKEQTLSKPGKAQPKPGDRDARGHFLPGHKSPGPGNPHAHRTARLRSALLEAVSPDDIREVVAGLVRAARCGDLVEVKLLLDRTLGRPRVASAPVSVDGVEALDLGTREGLAQAAARVLGQALVGTLDLEHAVQLAGMLAVVQRAQTDTKSEDAEGFARKVREFVSEAFGTMDADR